MTKIYESKTVQKTIRTHIKTVCDLCHDETVDEWEGRFEIAEVEVKGKFGTSYPEGGRADEYDFDICPTCFKEKILPWLCEQGVDTTPKEIDW